MSKKNKPDERGYVYSTDPGFRFGEDQKDQSTISPEKQKLKVRLDAKQRAGKTVTLVEGFIGKDAVLDDLGRQLKTYCGTGGSVKEAVIIIQGDQRNKVLQFLRSKGYKI